MFEDIESDDDEEIIEFIEYQRRPYTVRERTNYIDTLDDLDFKMRFRLKKETVLMILQQIEAQIETPTDRNFSVSPINKLLLALRFYATGSFLICAGDYFNVSKSTACKIVHKVTDAIASLSPQFIRMPSTEDEITAHHLDFYSIARLPRTIGSIDCTHIKIQSPGGNNAEVFRNRKGYFSINVQTVSSAKTYIIDLVARWPGSAHDQVVFENSSVYQRLHANEFGNSLFVADSGYTDTTHVVTPIDQADNEVEQLYSEAVCFRMKIYSICIIPVLVLLTSAATNEDKFPLCRICGCKFNAEDTAADVSCTKAVNYDIFHKAFWNLSDPKSNNTMINNTIPLYNSLTINYNTFINFSDILPPSNLTYLNLAHNSIYNISDNIFRNLQNMVVLILSYNDLEIVHPDTFKGQFLEARLMPLRSLKELRLDHNKIHSLNADIFEHTTDIEILDLSYNPLEVLDTHTVLAIDSLVKLKELYLQYTDIQTLPDHMLHTPKLLQTLDLSGNLKFSVIPTTFGQATNLQNLYLNNTGFVNLTHTNGFPNMPSVRVLHLCRNEYLHCIDKHAFSGLSNLTDLRLSDNIDLVHIHELALAKPTNISGGSIWPPLKKLYIGNNKLAYLESDLVARWDSLIELDIRENPWTCECENQWLIEDLMPIYLKLDEEKAKQVMCAAPIEMQTFSFYYIYKQNSHMRCLDTYGHRPERDGTMLVGILAGILIAIPLILFLLFAYQRKWFSIIGIFDKSPASYSRRYYSSASREDF